MISWRALLDEAQPLALGPVDEEFLDRAIAQLGGVKLPLRTAERFRYSKSIDELASVRGALEDAASTSDTDARLLAALLRRPLRAYPLATASTFALLGSWRVDDSVEPRIAVVRRADAGIVVDRTLYDVGETQDDLIATMERLYIEMDRAAREVREPTRRLTDRVLWIGGSEEDACDPIWRLRVEAALMAEGFTAVIRERPGRDSINTSRAVSEMSGAAVVCWVPHLSNPKLVTEIHQRSRVRVIELSEYVLADALTELRLTLAAEPIVRAETARAEDRPSPEFGGDGPYYFKKVAARRRGGDLLVHRREPCTHSSWTIAPKAPQARKGIEALTGRRIHKLEHCDGCTGGGMWRVIFA